MRHSRSFSCRILLCLLLSFPLLLPAQDTLRTYIFGHSLINHEFQVNITPSQETSVPHWFVQLAHARGDAYEVSGQYGFLPQHYYNLPPVAQWGFDSVPAAWDDNNETFAQANFDNIMITPGNFIQWLPPNDPFFNDSISPVEFTRRVFDWTNQQEDSLVLYIYENWPDMAPDLSNGFPPNATEWANYNARLNGDFHNWNLEYHDSVLAHFPNQCVPMIPVGPAISHLLLQSPYDQIPIDSLYEDDAPHGRPTIYFLAAMITYMAMYEEQVPTNYTPPADIHPLIANNYNTVGNILYSFLLNFNFPNGDSRVFCNLQTPLAIGDDPAEVWEEDLEDAIQVYPNPTNGMLQIACDWETYDVEVMDLQGKVLLGGTRENAVSMDLTSLPGGMYLVRIRNRMTGANEVEKILKR